jgi:endonuclease/exonuclease/phosphatase family metal-dependent hydrolase
MDLGANTASAGKTQGTNLGGLRVVSWNLLRRVGADVEDVAKLVRREHPDLFLLQEATDEINALPSLVGGHFFRHPMQKRIYGLAVWSPHPLRSPQILSLPVSALPGRVPPRVAQIVQLHGVTIANVHLSHGQFLNRRQLLRVAGALHGPAAIIGDFNSVGPVILPGFEDVGPRRRTHKASNIVSLRLDRCMTRSMRCASAKVLEKGSSDHHPIVLDLAIATETGTKLRKKRFRPSNSVRRFTDLKPTGPGIYSKIPDRIRRPFSRRRT